MGDLSKEEVKRLIEEKARLEQQKAEEAKKSKGAIGTLLSNLPMGKASNTGVRKKLDDEIDKQTR
jgi:hypothetical protein